MKIVGKRGINLIVIGILSFGLIGCGSNSSSNDDEIDDNTTKYYDISVYQAPDKSFEKVLTSGSYEIYTKTDDYWDSISVVTIDDAGVVKIILRKTFYDDEYGTHAKSAYDEFKLSLDEKYEEDKEYDVCLGTDYICSADNYAYSLAETKRLKTNFYKNYTAYFDYDSINIALEKNSMSIYNIDLVVNYETQIFLNFKDQTETEIADNL
jgi:hypothetical protein